MHLTNAFSDYSSPELSQDLHAIFANSNLTRLIKLHLEQNEISHFKDPNVFCSLPKIEDLYMGDNSLKEINFNITCLQSLRFLDLERNRFEILTKTDIKVLERKERLILDFSMNPFACDCSIYPFVKFLRSTNLTVREKDKLICNQNEEHTDSILSLDLRKCIVKSQYHYTTINHQLFFVFFSIVLVFILIGICGGLLYINKDEIRKFISPVVSSRKVHYTTIRDDDCVQEVHV